ncbi:Subtilase family protein [Nitrosospira sp. Nsp14]|uniref:S8 family peptidase n=1 Tax=Nitrosospira sp. Nsp14 TaxID=1855333 RepID=UPI0008E6951B|nr:S8 family serine peptidase [Nitrosospira sp. Nsp14]SFH58197.1 Subtilase family protein [Nitrosospira sp. Nsp14]
MTTRNKLKNIAALSFILTAIPVVSAQPVEESSIPLPSAEQRTYLESREGSGTRGPSPVVSTTVEISKVPPDSIFFDEIKSGKAIHQPLQSANELLILLDPKLTGKEIRATLDVHQLDVINSIPQIGAIVVDASRRLGAAAVTSSTSSLSKMKDAPLDVLARDLAKDARFLSVTPNSLISSFALKSAVTPTFALPTPDMATERVDWGIMDSRFDKVWPLMTAPFVVGVIDSGFAPHEDLDTRAGLSGALKPIDHGNHVSGIMCAKHNGIGIKGGLKSCTVVQASASTMLTGGAAPEGGRTSRFVTHFSEYVGTVLDFMEANPTVRVINISLGYNWMPNFNIDPRTQGSEQIRDVVKNQGRIFASVLAYAKRRDIALVMAAGNDSSALNQPLEAQWASPFNYGAMLMAEKDGWANALIVQAHGPDNRRAAFSNISGDVSCPGVDVLSTLASGTGEYGELTGTSMASPYCAAGLVAVLGLRPELKLREAIACIKGGSEKIDGSVAKLNVQHAVSECKK